jgi:aryl-alcohol dehydrogenase-like predicted oxidoreductase
VGVRENKKPNLSYDYIKSACEDSLKRLDTEYIDIYNVHFNDPNTPVEETIGALQDLINEGKIRKYGLGHLPKERVIEYIKKGDVFSVLIELSAVSRKSSEELLPLCRENNVGGIAFSITGRGLLTGKFNKDSCFEKGDIRNLDPQFKKEKLEFSLEIMRKLKEIGKRHKMSSVQVAIAWVLSQKGIISALTGPSTEEHLEENIEGSKKKFAEREMNEIDKYIKEKEKWLKKEEIKTIKNIIYNDLSEDIEKAFVDLIYCIEISITNEYVDEQEIMPIFYKLYGMRNELYKVKAIDLENIQKEVKEIINIK